MADIQPGLDLEYLDTARHCSSGRVSVEAVVATSENAE